MKIGKKLHELVNNFKASSLSTILRWVKVCDKALHTHDNSVVKCACVIMTVDTKDRKCTLVIVLRSNMSVSEQYLRKMKFKFAADEQIEK